MYLAWYLVKIFQAPLINDGKKSIENKIYLLNDCRFRNKENRDGLLRQGISQKLSTHMEKTVTSMDSE